MAGSGVQYSKLGDLREGLAEAARTDELNAARTVERFVELSPGHEGTLRARQHHLLSGRRGTGKSTLLHVVRAHLRESEVPVAVVDMEKFKNRPFPDVLVEILITLLDELRPPVRLKTFFPRLGGAQAQVQSIAPRTDGDASRPTELEQRTSAFV